MPVPALAKEHDPVESFLNERCTFERTARVSAKELYIAYQAWCETYDDLPMSKALLGAGLARLGYQSKKSTGGNNFWLGLELAESSEPEAIPA